MPTKLLPLCAAILAVLIQAPCAPRIDAAVISPQLQATLAAGSPEPVAAIITLTAAETPAMLAKRLGPRQRGQIVSELKRSAQFNRSNLNRFLRQRNIEQTRPLWLINGIAVSAPPDVLFEVASLSNVQAITLDESLQLPSPLDSSDRTAEWNISRTGAPQLWDMGFDGTGITIAILDSGVNIDHPDLAERWRGENGDWFDPYTDSTAPYDFGIYHGTGVAGIAVGGNSSGSSIGMAPGAQLIAAKLFRDDGTANVSYIIEALQWALNPGGNPDRAPAVINNSWGFTDNSGECLATLGTGQNALHLRSAIQTIRETGIVVISSAGNSGPADNTSISPANFSESLAVGAIDFYDNIAGFSSRGPSACSGDLTYPDLVAAGTSVRTAAGGRGINAGYQYMTGTSFSSPHVAGAAALLLSAVDNLSVADLESALKEAAVDLGPAGVDTTYGHGRMDVVRALFLIDEDIFLPVNPLLTLIGTIPNQTDTTTEVLDFGFLLIEDSAEKTVELRNNGGNTLEITDLIDELESPFTLQQNNCNKINLAAGESCELVIDFSAADRGDYTDHILIASNDQQRPQITLQLTGSADVAFPELTVEPAAISFGQIVPDTSASQVLVLENRGTATVENISVETSELLAPFSISANSCNSILEPGESCGVTVRFSSDTAGSYQGRIFVSSSDPEVDNLPILISGISNSPPSRPKPISPVTGTVVSGTETVTLVWEAAMDADGDDITHTIVLADNSDLNHPVNLNGAALLLGVVFLGAGISLHDRKLLVIILSLSLLWISSCGGGGGGSGGDDSPAVTARTLSQTVGPLPAGTYYWKVTAEDERGGTSESTLESFVVD